MIALGIVLLLLLLTLLIGTPLYVYYRPSSVVSVPSVYPSSNMNYLYPLSYPSAYPGYSCSGGGFNASSGWGAPPAAGAGGYGILPTTHGAPPAANIGFGGNRSSGAPVAPGVSRVL